MNTSIFNSCFTPRPLSFFLFLLATLLSHQDSKAQGNLLIYPKRLVFDGSSRSQQLSLVNNGKDTAHYVISVIQIRMKEDGGFETITAPDPGQQFAEPYFRFYPRSVVLGPNEAQTVKVQLIKTGEMQTGEYRSHMYFRAEPEKKPLGDSSASKNTHSISVNITPVFGISIPVIIRVGEATTDISLSRISFTMEKDTVPVLGMDLDRTGNMSVFGDITVDYLSPEGKEIRVGNIKNVAVYTPNNKRRIRMMLDKNDKIDYRKGALHVVFTDLSGPVRKLAQEQVILNGQNMHN